MVNIKHKFNIENNEICAGGVIIYRIIDDKKQNITEDDIELLMINSQYTNKFEDFGGRVDKTDVDIYETVAREAFEESNKLLTFDSVLKRIKNKNVLSAYVKYSKYNVFIVEATEDEKDLQTSMFGIKEIHDNIDRTVHWISLKTFYELATKKQLNIRLINKSVFDMLLLLKDQYGIVDKNKVNIKETNSIITYLF